LILKNHEFFTKYKDYLYVSISYDFIFQPENRTAYDIEGTLRFLDDLKIDKQLQYVIPINRKEAFDVEVFSSIVSLYKKFRINSLNLIMLRHQRAVDEFKTIISSNEIDLKRVFSSFIQFVQLLYVSGINVAIDGHSGHIDKHYYSNHKQIVLSPDGFIYPEYQFIEYKHAEFKMGQWRHPIALERNVFSAQAVNKIRPQCQTCSMQRMCGLQYYYAMFDINPPTPEKCFSFYSYLELSLTHLFKLKKHRNLLESIGV
jgi:radical SAM protein with 4Fe4S-binding SPASM domain